MRMQNSHGGEWPEQNLSVDHHWIVLFLSMAASAGIAVGLGQDAGFDLLNYHYYSGFAFLHKPFGYDFAPAQIQSFHNPLMHVLSYLMLAHLPAKAAAALLGAIQGINFYLVFQISQALFAGLRNPYRYILCLSNAAAGYYGVASRTELGTTYGDNLISILVLSGLLLILRRLRTLQTAKACPAFAFAVAGMAIGVAFGLKPTAAVYFLAVALSAPIALLRTGRFGRPVAALYGGLIIGFLAAYAFWGFKLYSNYQNPFFPYFNKTFHSSYYDPKNFWDPRFFPRDWRQVFFYPFYFIRKNHLVSEMDFRDLRLALCYLAITLLSGLCLFRFIQGIRDRGTRTPARQHDLCLLFLAPFFFLTYIIWQHQSSFYPYLLVLELLAPAFLALAASRFSRRKSFIFWSSAVFNLIILATAAPINFGRQKFDDDLLKLQIPTIRDLDQSIILMTGYEPISYIVPSFPKTTRFARISSTFMTPGRNVFLDETIRKLLASYDTRHILAYAPNAEQIGLARLDTSFYGRMIDERSCFEIRSRERNRGYLCGIVGGKVETAEKPVPELGYFPRFIKEDAVKFKAWAAKDCIDCQIAGIKAGSVDILYTLNGERMPSVRSWPLDSPSRLHLGPLGRSGVYAIIGIRDSSMADPDLWIKINASVRIEPRSLSEN